MSMPPYLLSNCVSRLWYLLATEAMTAATAGEAPLTQNLPSTTHSDLLSAEQKNPNQQNSSRISAAEDRVSVTARCMSRSSTRYTRTFDIFTTWVGQF